ncbi:hypothetical protein AU476_09395 [Cupriavidus sp. UYMSc13B]|nr:hypothetical protein AU476_09395 [Cupriavidus sp. UYMSc13B]
MGFSLLLTGQLFSAEGLQALAPQSAAPDHLTNQGSASSFGVGVRLGAYWRASDVLAFGAAYSPRIRMGRLKEYEGLLADQGRLDIPENMLLGLQWSPTQDLSFLFDYQRINYSGTSGLGNPSFDGTALRGSSGGPGNGWKDMNVFKVGVRYQVTPALNVSGGVSFNSAAYADADTANNVTAPATFAGTTRSGLATRPGPTASGRSSTPCLQDTPPAAVRPWHRPLPRSFQAVPPWRARSPWPRGSRASACSTRNASDGLRHLPDLSVHSSRSTFDAGLSFSVPQR